MTEPIVLPHGLHGDPGGRAWQHFRDGIEVSWLYANGAHGPAAAYLRYAAGARVPFHWHPGYEHVLVLEGVGDRFNVGASPLGPSVQDPPSSHHPRTFQHPLASASGAASREPNRNHRPSRPLPPPPQTL